MDSPFAGMIDDLFESELAVDATYIPANGSGPAEVRIMLVGPDRLAKYGQVQVASTTAVIDVRRSQVSRPAAGDLVRVGERIDVLVQDPLSDSEGLVWTCWTEPLA